MRPRPDDLFSAPQQQRVTELMRVWRRSRDLGQVLAAEEQRELEGLVEAELRAATDRTRVIAGELGR